VAHLECDQENPLLTHRSLALLTLAMGVTLAACTAQAPTPANPADKGSLASAPSGSPPGPAAAPPATCPDADFDAFLTRFSRDIAVQEKATADPLSQSVIDPEAQPEPRMVTRQVPLAEVEWPVIPNIAAARNGGREVVISSEGDNGRKVLVRTPDTDDQQTYHFIQRPCWTLVSTTEQGL
jgi:hypothetical protein